MGLGHSVSKEKTRVGRLVVGYILPSDRQTVLRIMHQSWHSVLGRYCSRKDAQLATIRRAGDQFLSPVTQDIGRKAWIRFTSVIGSKTKCSTVKQYLLTTSFVIPFYNIDAVQQLSQKVAVPPNRHILGARPRSDVFPFLQSHAANTVRV